MAVKSSLKNMVLCLCAITLVCGLLLGGVYVLTAEPIAAAAKAKSEKAMALVLPPFDRLSSVIEAEGGSYCLALSKGGDTLGVAVTASAVGFGGPVTLMVGFLPDGTVYGTSVLSQAETPGLGAKCVEPAFADQFKGFNPRGKSLAVRKDGGDVDAITAATITSRAYCVAVDNAHKIMEGIEK